MSDQTNTKKPMPTWAAILVGVLIGIFVAVTGRAVYDMEHPQAVYVPQQQGPVVVRANVLPGYPCGELGPGVVWVPRYSSGNGDCVSG